MPESEYHFQTFYFRSFDDNNVVICYDILNILPMILIFLYEMELMTKRVCAFFIGVINAEVKRNTKRLIYLKFFYIQFVVLLKKNV